MFKALTPLVLFLTFVFPAMSGAGETSVRLYAFGNSLVHHLSDDPDTNVPVWL
ncbi:MAG: hypothetical protein GY945_09535, partial [Rhodobacteraceae bacterium]|nr:hypothetical protein [Paracoccaceae bacterium]